MPKPHMLEPQVRNLLRRGLAHHRAGRMGAAQACYRRSLKLDPRCAQAFHLLGLLAQQTGHVEESIQLVGQSLAINPDDADALNTLADSRLGLGDIPGAVECLQRLAEIHPQSAETHHRLGKAQEKLGDWESAVASYQRAIALAPHAAELYCTLAKLQSKREAYGDAVESCRRALAENPRRHESYTQLGLAFTGQGNFAAAAEAFRRAIALKPDCAETIFGLGYLFERQADLAGAAESYRYAMKLDPQLAVVHLHLGEIYLQQGEVEKAGERLAQVQKLEPDSAEVNSLRGLIHLQQGDFARGLPLYESRWKTVYGLRQRRKFPQPLWKGEPLNGARILLHPEQGLGDTLQFVRYVPLVAAQGGKVILELPARLHRLLAATAEAEKTVPWGEPLPEFDWQCPLMSLPFAMGTALGTIPAHIPYVFPDSAQVEVWRQRLEKETLRVGLVWAGNAKHPQERWRSIPLNQLAPLTQIAGATFYSLQMGPPAAILRQPSPGWRLIDLQDEQRDFADTAAIVANLDLVISIDTSVAHLAGAMGKPVWILLCKSPDWRWLLDREDSPWYPTARLFRQSVAGNWQDVLARVEGELHALAASASHAGSACPEAIA